MPLLQSGFLQLAALGLLSAPASGWISLSQARYAASLDELARATYGLSQANAYRSLGWVWNTPTAPFDTSGLGSAITWAVDPALCDALLPHVRESR